MGNNQVGLDLNIVDNEITNVETILNFINHVPLDSNLIDHITTLKNKISGLDLSNKQELENAIDSKIMEFKLQHEQANSTSLNVLKQTNEEFQKLSLIQTIPDKNDSNKYIDYLTYTNQLGEIEVLSFTNSNILSDFIKENTDSIPELTAKELFNNLKIFGCEELNFESNDEYKKSEYFRKKAIINNPEIERQELEEVDEYKKKYGIALETEITITESGERLYKIGDGLIKFRTSENKRVMDVLKQPSINQSKIYNNLLAELEDSPSIQMQEYNEVATTINVDTYSSLEFISENEFDKEKLIDLVSKRDIYDITLTGDEEHLINVCIKYLLETYEISNEETREIITDLMENKRGNKASIVERYNDFENGSTDDFKLTDLEKEFARIYIEKKEKLLSQIQEKNNHKKRKLKPSTQSGVATIVILLELMMLAIFIMMFLRLDI